MAESLESYSTAPLLQKWNNNNNKDDDHDDETKTVSFFRTCLNGLNALSGVGILSVSYAVACGGWLSLIVLLVIATTSFYSGILIKRCMDTDTNILTYPDIGQLAFGQVGRAAVSVSMYTEIYLVATGFLIMEGDNLHKLFPETGKHVLVLLVGLVILPTVWLDDLTLLSYVSGSGVLASAVIIGSVFCTAATFDESVVEFNGKGTTLLNWSGIPTSVSLFAFCYCAHPVFPSLYNSMRNKRHFSHVLLVCFVVSTAGYAFMAVIGYLMFGVNVESQITLNLPKDKLSSQVAVYTTLVNPISKYALMVTPITNALKTLLPKKHNKNRLISILISTTLVISTIAVALSIPFFGSLTSLVGAFLSVTASILLPCACYLKISGTYKEFRCETLVIVMIIVLGVVIGIFGTYTSLLEIIQQF